MNDLEREQARLRAKRYRDAKRDAGAPSVTVKRDVSVTPKPEIVTLRDATVTRDVRFRDSQFAPGIYQVCVAHGKRYCRPCGTLQPQQSYSPDQWSEAYRLIAIARDAAKQATRQQADSA